MDELVEKYIELRDRKAARVAKHKAEMVIYDEALDKIEAAVLQHFQDHGMESVRTKHGTAYKSVRTSASVADWDVVLKHIQDNGLWQLLERRVNKQGVEEYKQENGDIPPGINIRSEVIVNVRRS